MAYFDYQKAAERYAEDPFMLEIIERLEEMDLYHLLRDCDDSFQITGSLLTAPADYRKWLTVCNGGLLFSTTLLSGTEYDGQMEVSFSTIEEWNTGQKYQLLNLPRGYTIIALVNYGDPVCVSAEDSRVYLWDTAEQVFATVWDSFADFLADEYNTAVEMVEDQALEPIPLKIAEESDGQ